MSLLSRITKLKTGIEPFVFNEEPVGYSLCDFWRFSYSELAMLQDDLSEFIVCRALGICAPINKAWWTLYDILYKEKYRVEVKQTSYYHLWGTSETRRFNIERANSSYEDGEHENKLERQNDIYVFCVNTGRTKEEAYPLNLDCWEFYVVPTSIVNEVCGNNKTVSLARIVKDMHAKPIRYNEIKSEVDRIIEEMT